MQSALKGYWYNLIVFQKNFFFLKALGNLVGFTGNFGLTFICVVNIRVVKDL